MLTAMLCVQKDKRSTFQPKSRKCVFLGYPLDYKGWKCWDPVTGDVFISRDVKFVETEMPGVELDLVLVMSRYQAQWEMLVTLCRFLLIHPLCCLLILLRLILTILILILALNRTLMILMIRLLFLLLLLPLTLIRILLL